MKPVDVVLSVLTLSAVAMGFAAYRAWHPELMSAVIEPSVENRPAELPLPGDVVPASVRRLPVVYGATLGRTWCRHGLLYWESPNGSAPVYVNGRYSGCQIRAEPARPDSSTAND